MKTNENLTIVPDDEPEPIPYITERRQLEIDVARAHGWRVEPYVATIEAKYGKPHLMGQYDRFRLLDETGAVKGDWAFTEESAWMLVPQWASISADRDELERHACERFGDIDIQMVGTEESGGSVLCVIGGRKGLIDEGGSGTGHSFEEKGVAVCRAYLAACQREARDKETDALFPRE